MLNLTEIANDHGDAVEELFKPIAQRIGLLKDQLIGKIASENPEHGRAKGEFIIRDISFRGGRAWLSGPILTKSGAPHARVIEQVCANSRYLTIREPKP